MTGTMKGMGASMALAQVVGLFKAEATIQLTMSVDDPYWLRFWVYVMLGGCLTLLLSYVNVRVIRWFDR